MLISLPLYYKKSILMDTTYIQRQQEKEIAQGLNHFPASAILGPRQCGKSSMAKHILASHKNALYLDAEKPSDLKKLSDPELFFDLHKDKLICIDEIQRIPELFPVLRSVIDERHRNAQFLLLGSASPDLLKQSSETLAGRIVYYELPPFLFNEITSLKTAKKNPMKYWLGGGFPRSFLAETDDISMKWRQNFIHTFLEKDIPRLGFNIPALTMNRLWTMCAHLHGQTINYSQLGSALGLSHTTIRGYIELLTQTFVVRLLMPFHENVKKRLIKAPKVYIRDTGILHALLNIETPDDLLSHPVCGFSWEAMVIENILFALNGWEAGFYRTATGVEIDLVLAKGRKKIVVECKSSSAPDTSKGFWTALDDIKPDEAWIIAPVKEAYPLKKNVMVAPLDYFLKKYSKK